VSVLSFDNVVANELIILKMETTRSS